MNWDKFFFFSFGFLSSAWLYTFAKISETNDKRYAVVLAMQTVWLIFMTYVAARKTAQPKDTQ